MDLAYKHPKIYLISGKARHGKSTVGELLKELYEAKGQKVIITPYAKYIKIYAEEIFGWDGKEATKPRELLQQLGTDIIRVKLNKPKIFIDRMIEDIEIYAYFFDVIIIPDARFIEEILAIKNKFDQVTTINVFRNGFENDLSINQRKHPTEISLDSYNDFDYKIVVSSLGELKTEVIKLFNE